MGMSKRYSLKSRKRIDLLMAEGTRVKAYPIHMVYRDRALEADIETPVQFVYTAPKRIFSKAVARNAKKRHLKEALRPFIPELVQFMEKQGIACDMMLIYVGKEDFELIDISVKIKVLLDRWKEQVTSPDIDEQIQKTP